MIWLSASQIAGAAAQGLMPTMPTCQRSVKRMAGDWDAQSHARQRSSVGGGLEYHINALPAAARIAWLSHHLNTQPAPRYHAADDAPLTTSGDARAALLRMAAQLRSISAQTQAAADRMFCEAYNGGAALDVAPWLRAAIPSVAPRSLARWRAQAAQHMGTQARGRPKGSGVLDRAEGGAVRHKILAAIASQPFLSAKHLRALICDQYQQGLTMIDPDTGEASSHPVPTLRMFQIALAQWRDTYSNELLRLSDPDAYRSRVEFTATGSQRADRLNEVWQIDASPADVMLKGGRHSIYMAVDVYSRRAAVLVTPTPRAEGVGLLIRKCLLKWGVPSRIHTDNGSDFVAHQTKRLFATLDIEVELSPPYNPKSKGIVERTIGTFQRDLATCPGFIGHSVADRKVIENRKAFNRRLGASAEELFDVQMNIKEMQEWCDAWSDTIYAHSGHGGLQGRTPYEVAAGYAGRVLRIEHDAALDVLLAPLASGNGVRRVTKTGVRANGAHYLPLGVMPGTQVLVRMDPADMGRVMLFDPETHDYLGEAINPDLAGLNPAQVTAQAKELQKAYEGEKLKDIRREMRRLRPQDVAGALRREGERRAEVITAFPQRTAAHSTPALDAAAKATGAAPPAASSSITPEARAAMVRQFAPQTPKDPVEKPMDRWRRACALERRQKEGEAISDADEAWLTCYKTTPEYRVHSEFYSDQKLG